MLLPQEIELLSLLSLFCFAVLPAPMLWRNQGLGGLTKINQRTDKNEKGYLAGALFFQVDFSHLIRNGSIIPSLVTDELLHFIGLSESKQRNMMNAVSVGPRLLHWSAGNLLHNKHSCYLELSCLDSLYKVIILRLLLLVCIIALEPSISVQRRSGFNS